MPEEEEMKVFKKTEILSLCLKYTLLLVPNCTESLKCEDIDVYRCHMNFHFLA